MVLNLTVKKYFHLIRANRTHCMVKPKGMGKSLKHLMWVEGCKKVTVVLGWWEKVICDLILIFCVLTPLSTIFQI